MLTAIGQQFVGGFALGRRRIDGRVADGDECGNRLAVWDVGGGSDLVGIEDPHDDGAEPAGVGSQAKGFGGDAGVKGFPVALLSSGAAFGWRTSRRVRSRSAR
jgi:hypothetical protein